MSQNTCFNICPKKQTKALCIQCIIYNMGSHKKHTNNHLLINQHQWISLLVLPCIPHDQPKWGHVFYWECLVGNFEFSFRFKKRSQSELMGMQGRNAEPGQWLVSYFVLCIFPQGQLSQATLVAMSDCKHLLIEACQSYYITCALVVKQHKIISICNIHLTNYFFM